MNKKGSLLGWAVFFLILGLVSAMFGFGLIAGMSIGIAKWLAIIFIIIFIVTAIAHYNKKHS
jgi:uncharacterized membrane protein YtjA (UPF0391 family)